MDPIVLAGGGEYHYKLLLDLPEELAYQQPIVLLHPKSYAEPHLFAPIQLSCHQRRMQNLDLWSLCQKRGVHFIQDECVDISFEDQKLFLKNAGKIKFSKISFELEYHMQPLAVQKQASLLSPPHLQGLNGELQLFFREVKKHCPRDIAVVLKGFHPRVLHYAYLIQKELRETCQQVSIDIFPGEDEPLWMACEGRRLQKCLKPYGIKIRGGESIETLEPHKLKTKAGETSEFDIFFAMDNWRCHQTLAKRLLDQDNGLIVDSRLRTPMGVGVFAVAPEIRAYDDLAHVGMLNWLPIEEVTLCLRDQLFSRGELTLKDHYRSGKKQLWQAPYLFSDWLGQGHSPEDIDSLLKSEFDSQLGFNKPNQAFSASEKELRENLQYQQAHMARPWGRGRKKATLPGDSASTPFRMHSVKGFDWWGGAGPSTEHIASLAFLKSWSQGVEPTHLHFHLALPRSPSTLRQHLFESSLLVMENLCRENDVEFEGGTTADSDHWQLYVTVGGRPSFELSSRFRLHDYLLVTRPLGYGALWTSRLDPRFNSKWITEVYDSPLLCAPHALLEFIAEYDPSCLALVEEWGFLYHTLEHLPGQSQLTLNFRQVPRWQGVDELIDTSLQSPQEDENWERLTSHAPFKREEVSTNNRVLWDSLSQGSLVIGVAAEKYPQALGKLKQMGYTHASLVGCVRPQSKGFKFVLSDWKP